jgi:hypothetical protein
MAVIEVSQVQRRAELDGGKANFDNGYLRLYSGTRPVHPETALSGNTLLAELRFGATAFPAASGDGTRTANAITSDAAADATGTVTFFRAFKSDGTTVIMQGDVSTSGASLNINSTQIQQNATVSVTSLTDTLPE